MQVDNGDHLYLAGESMIPTTIDGGAGLRSVLFGHARDNQCDLLAGMSRTEIVMRLLSAEARIRLTGQLVRPTLHRLRQQEDAVG